MEKKGTAINSLLTGKVWKVLQEEGTKVKKGDTILIMEAMKVEIPIEAPFDGEVRRILTPAGAQIVSGQTIAIVA